ncbi:hypothetical protein JCM19274_5009 [Algibacter lectus]|uniref:Uncharacterized protein n=1 Tax=Algibacter lectus TaxID=221126 RepID=A0A090WJW7_9FLAO|nr:hypothetical protein JCM19274_5009 [Algibacter lectus]
MEELNQELSKNNFFIVKYGLIVVFLTISLVLLALGFIKIENKSILLLVLEYYFKM